MAMSNTPSPVRPAKDEWGVYDPEQAGLAALFARLDAAKKPGDTAPATPGAAALERLSMLDAK